MAGQHYKKSCIAGEKKQKKTKNGTTENSITSEEILKKTTKKINVINAPLIMHQHFRCVITAITEETTLCLTLQTCPMTM